MPTSNWTRIVIALAAVVALPIVWLTGHGLDVAYTKALITASSAVVLFLLAFDRWLWRFAPLRWLSGRPVLNGTWKVKLRTTFAARADEVIESYLVIRQTYSHICADILFDRSDSRSLSADLISEHGRCVLYYLFRSEAHTRHRDGNPPRRGGAVLTVAREPKLHLKGDYWTEESNAKGDLKTVGYSSKTYDTYEKAQLGDYH